MDSSLNSEFINELAVTAYIPKWIDQQIIAYFMGNTCIWSGATYNWRLMPVLGKCEQIFTTLTTSN